MFDHKCTACGKRQLIFPTQVASVTNTADGIVVAVHLLVRRGPDLGHRSPGHRQRTGARLRPDLGIRPLRRGE